MILLIEGCDKSGKSTVIKDLCELNHDEPIVFKLSQKPESGNPNDLMKLKTAYLELFHQAKKLSDQGRTIIFDRAYPSELAYSMVKRGYDSFQEQWIRKLDNELGERLDTLLVYCEASKEVLSQRFEKLKEEFLEQSEIEQILQRYEMFLSTTKIPIIRINSTENRLKNLDKVIQML